MKRGKKFGREDCGLETMKNKFVICALIFNFLFLGCSVSANSDNAVKSAIQKSELSKTALISVSVKDIETKDAVVFYNENTPASAASVQKIVTTIPAIDTLGKNYEFNTYLYKNKDCAYFKLGADPYLTSRNLREMTERLNVSSLKSIYIDSSIVDNIEWGEGWQWDNTLNHFMPKFGAFNLDSNLITITIKPTSNGSPAEILTSTFYPITFENNAVTSSNQNTVSISGRDYVQPDFIVVSGKVSRKNEFVIPINNLKKYFALRLKDALRKNKIAYYNKIQKSSVPDGAKLVSNVKHPLENAIYDIMQKSNNMMSETVFKLAGGKYVKATGTEASAQKMFYDYYKKEGIDTSSIKITDASGVSKNNLLTADFITNVLVNDYNKPNAIKNYMAKPGVGTLSNRMLYFQDRLLAKTGTLTNVSAVAGYIKADSGKTYAFCILVNDAKSKEFEKKTFEEYVLRAIAEQL